MSDINTILSINRFLPIDDDIKKECELNPILIPLGFRHLDMGLIEVVASYSHDSNQYFLFEIGGPSGIDYENNKQRMEQLNNKNSLSLTQLMRKI
jgi:hypothetical protein